jgi:hypothetical protein
MAGAAGAKSPPSSGDVCEELAGGWQKGYCAANKIERLNTETGEYEPHNPTQGKGNSENNVVDPQKWVDESSANSAEDRASINNWIKKNIEKQKKLADDIQKTINNMKELIEKRKSGLDKQKTTSEN